MIKFNSSNAERLTVMNAWTIRDHLGEFVNIHLVDGDDDERYLECALNYHQISQLANSLNLWLSDHARSVKPNYDMPEGKI